MAEHYLETRSIPQLVSELGSNLSTLVRKEIALARAELADKAGKAGKPIGAIAGGVALLLLASIALTHALALALATAMGLVWAYIVTGVAFAVVGGLLARAAAERLKRENLAPERAARQLQETVRAARDPAAAVEQHASVEPTVTGSPAAERAT